jgi:hypothetical protein
MRGWSFPLGRWMGVELRIHTFFILLLGICMAYTESVHLSMFRGVGCGWCCWARWPCAKWRA